MTGRASSKGVLREPRRWQERSPGRDLELVALSVCPHTLFQGYLGLMGSLWPLALAPRQLPGLPPAITEAQLESFPLTWGSLASPQAPNISIMRTWSSPAHSIQPRGPGAGVCEEEGESRRRTTDGDQAGMGKQSRQALSTVLTLSETAG